MVSLSIQKRVNQKIQECLDIIQTRYGTTLDFPKVTYDVRGTTAGKASYLLWKVMFNRVLLIENEDEFVAQTVPHEVAHLITHRLYPRAKAHGPEWKRIMVILGARPERCHSFDARNAQVKIKRKFEYVCSRCQASFALGPVRHKKILRGVVYRHSCGGTISFVKRLGQVTNTQAREMFERRK